MYVFILNPELKTHLHQVVFFKIHLLSLFFFPRETFITCLASSLIYIKIVNITYRNPALRKQSDFWHVATSLFQSRCNNFINRPRRHACHVLSGCYLFSPHDQSGHCCSLTWHLEESLLKGS